MASLDYKGKLSGIIICNQAFVQIETHTQTKRHEGLDREIGMSILSVAN